MTATTPPAITAPGASPDPTDRTTYNARAYAWMQWLKDHAVPEIYADALNCYNNALDAEASATAASSSASTASTAVSGIGSSVSAAAASATSADNSAIAALASLNAFKGVYYGASASNPTLDPLGAAMSAGDLYYNTAVPEMRVWDGSAWVAAYLPTAGFATLTGAQTLDEKTLTGTPSINGGAVSGLKEKIINGRMEVSQYNGTSAVTPATSNTYPIDRWKTEISVALYSKLSFQQVTDAPTGFRNSLKATVVTQTAPGASDYYAIEQIIEGFNVSDLAFGGASALPVTVSFYAKASVAGTYSISLLNGAQNRLYISTVSLTTSWARYSVLIPGDVTGTWTTDNTASLTLRLDLGSGSTYASGTAGAWSATSKWSTSGSVTFVNQVAGSTLNITGVSLKAGDCRNELYNEWRPYADEERLCQRYLPKWKAGAANSYIGIGLVETGAPNTVRIPVIAFPATARATPTGVTISTASHFQYVAMSTGTQYTASALTYAPTGSSTQAACVTLTVTGPTAPNYGVVYVSSSSAYILFDGCEL